jgi:hypothetical protein
MAAIHKAVLFVALAVIGDIPVNIKVGNVIKLPPLAIALSGLVMNAVLKRSKLWTRVKLLGILDLLLRKNIC